MEGVRQQETWTLGPRYQPSAWVAGLIPNMSNVY